MSSTTENPVKSRSMQKSAQLINNQSRHPPCYPLGIWGGVGSEWVPESTAFLSVRLAYFTTRLGGGTVGCYNRPGEND